MPTFSVEHFDLKSFLEGGVEQIRTKPWQKCFLKYCRRRTYVRTSAFHDDDPVELKTERLGTITSPPPCYYADREDTRIAALIHCHPQSYRNLNQPYYAVLLGRPKACTRNDGHTVRHLFRIVVSTQHLRNVTLLLYCSSTLGRGAFPTGDHGGVFRVCL